MKTKILLLLLIATATAINTQAQPAPPAGNQWQLADSDDFNSFDTNRWGYGSTPWGSENQSSCNLIPAADTYVSGGSLVLRARSGSFVRSDGTVFPYSSGWAWLKTWRTYGYIEIRAQFPNQQGAWPAFWMLGDGWPPEFDIAEWRGAPKNYMTLAFYDGSWTTTTQGGNYTGWHTYGLEWLPGSLRWYIDGQLVKSHHGSTVPTQPMYVILSNGTDCNDGNGSGLPSYFNIDYYRWYQLAPNSGGVVSGQTYSIFSRHNNKAVDAAGTGNNANVISYTYWGGDNQRWTVVPTSDGYYRVMNVASGRAMDAGGTANNSPVQIYSYWGGNNQQWAFNNLGNGYFSITNRASGRALDINGTENHAPAQVYSYWGGQNQQFRLNPLSSGSSGARIAQPETMPPPEAETLNDGITMFPNPSPSGHFTIRLPGESSMNVEVFDAQGKRVFHRSAEGRQLEVNRNLPAGVYAVKVTSGNVTSNRKLVVK